MLGGIVERDRAIEMRSPVYDIPVCSEDKPMMRCAIMSGPVALCLSARARNWTASSRIVAVERDKIRDPKAVKNREQQHWIFRRLSERFSLFNQQS